MPSLISVVVTTYNWPQALAACIVSLLNQTDKTFEIIIADDGSNFETTQLILELKAKSDINISHVYHEDRGFRAGTIRNKAVSIATGEYIIFLDGDCMVLSSFIARHRSLAEEHYFVPGNRILLSEPFTYKTLKHELPLYQSSFIKFIGLRLTANINRISPLIFLPFRFFRLLTPKQWQKAMTCNLACWRRDFISVNGFDELYEGWGYEDSDLVIRLIHLGIERKEGRFAVPVLHLWHHQNDRTRHDQNYDRLMMRLNDVNCIRAEKGLDGHIQTPIA